LASNLFSTSLSLFVCPLFLLFWPTLFR
jgi:hypothetical protein